jgi:DNA-binding IclR family transcriptional regulator
MTSAANTRKTDYTNAAQQRLLQVVLALFSDVVMGLSPAALAKAVGCSQPVITRDLDNLKTAGVAERDEATGHWRLTPRLPQQAIKVWASIDRAERRIEESRQRFSRIPL